MKLPNLIVSSSLIRYQNKEDGSVLNLSRYLYPDWIERRSDLTLKLIETGKLGSPKLNRIPLLLAVKEELDTRYVMGMSDVSTITYLTKINSFFRFMEENQLPFSLDFLQDNFLQYAEYLHIKVNVDKGSLSRLSAFNSAGALSTLIGSILKIPPTVKLILRTRLYVPRKASKAVSNASEKQNLEDTFKFGSFLIDIIKGLTIESIHGELPLVIPLRLGSVQIKLFAGLFKTHGVPANGYSSEFRKLRQPSNNLRSKGGARRWILVGLRIDAELMLFISQTGMNVTQALELKRDFFKYKPLADGWQVRTYKNRKGGEVQFNIYKEYRSYFKEYLKFIDHYFPDSDSLFPSFNKKGLQALSRTGETSARLRKIALKYEIPWITARMLRNTRINYFLRRSGDYEFTAAEAQHTRRTLRENYEKPSQQRVMVEVTNFWSVIDPIKHTELKASVIGSLCNGIPEHTSDQNESPVQPNCLNPSGCLWCKHSRDIDSLDYIWSLASMRHLKILEASYSRSKSAIPADVVIDRISKKINWFKSSTEKRKEWAKEIESRIMEGSFHENWAPLINFLE